MTSSPHSPSGRTSPVSGLIDLGVEVVLGDVEALLLPALDGHARAHGLGEAVDVEHVVAELALEVAAEVVRERLGAVDAGAQIEVTCRVEAHLDRGVGDVHRVGGGAGQDGGAHLAQDADLALRVAGADGDGGAAGGDASVVSAEAAGKEAVAVADLHDVVLVAVGVVDGAREALAPDLYVMLGVGAHGRDAGRARRHVDLADVLERHGEHTVRIGVAQVLLLHEGNASDVVERLDRVRVEPGLVEALLVERDVLVHVDDGLLYPGELDLVELLARRVKNAVVVAHWAPPPLGNTM